MTAQKEVASHASPPQCVSPVSAAKPPRTNTTSPSSAGAAPALSLQVRLSAGRAWGAGQLFLRVSPGPALEAVATAVARSLAGRLQSFWGGLVILVCKPCSSPLVPKEPRKLSYAEVCQKPPKEPPPVPVQPLREHRTNIVPPAKTEENGTAEKAPEKAHDKVEGRMKDYSGFRGNGPPRGAAGKIREQRRQFGRRSSPQGAPRRVGKEQYVPPRSPK